MVPSSSSWHTLLLLLLPTCISAVTLDCEHIRVSKKSFDLSPLGGPKTVHYQQYLPPTISNTTFTLDLCKPLKRLSDLPKEEQCPSGTRVCGVEERFNTIEHTRQIDGVRAIAGEFSTSHGSGRALDPKVERLKESSNAEMEGLRIELNGGRYPDQRGGVTQKVVIELHCDAKLTGNEGFEDAEEKMGLDVDSYGGMRRRADDDDDDDDVDGPELPDLDKGKSLQFISYKSEGSDPATEVLRLTWKTKYACENAADLPPSDGEDPKKKKSSGGWGFFTWFIIVFFLLVASYIIFGSWLNYNRYGARGWDLIPHGDALRDLPYVAKEWVGGLVERVKGGGARGGYSAV
ncbi:hypothetical protein LTR62_001053 [Meristemomyces frigidus]|uniref:Autophagy-related protein 27 n=1 Tax=Meristemomyces frigidus TaxID=1508187 RepID=A0AAN7T8M5_9PEZI|nr:hypothetical protein LTR62_001053 [Meristemomyces frigidus]